MLSLLLVTTLCASPSLSWSSQPSLNENEVNRPMADRLYQGDIMRTPEQLAALNTEMIARTKRSAGNVYARKWNKNQPIAFYFNSSFDESGRKKVRDVLTSIAANTCLSFKENSNVGTQLHFYRGSGCVSYVGETPYPYGSTSQPISIAANCEVPGSIFHEVFHSLGLEHTHQRKDRDSFVTVKIDLVLPNKRDGFAKIPEAHNDNFDVPYEYGSVMHYQMDASSIDGQNTIVPTQAGFENTIGQRIFATFNDFKMVNRYYSCSEKCSKQMTCQNGGYTSPKDCNACTCHEFYTGTNCQTPRNEITLTASSPSAKTTFHQDQNNAIFGNMDSEKFGRDGPKIIRAPEGRKIRVTFSEISANNGKFKDCQRACQFLGIELVDNPSGDLSTMGKIFCCPTLAGTSFVSQSNVLGYKAYIAPGWNTDIVVTYTLV